MLNVCKFALCALFLGAVGAVCYRAQIDNFDRYVYEAIVRGRSQPLDVVYSIVKHESITIERSPSLDSPQHLREVEPMFAIRPVYLATISALSQIFPIQKTISLISASALFGTGIVVLFWTRRPLLTGLLMAAYPIPYLGRLGGPDAMAALLVISALWLLNQRRSIALVLLFISLGVRTDDILVLLAVLAWLTWAGNLPPAVGALLAALAVGIVLGINHWAGNYGWIVLIRCSFIGGHSPAEMPHVLTMREYIRILVDGIRADLDRIAIWLLLGILAWRRRREPLLVAVGCAAAARFLLFPSPEDRYLIWAYIVAGVALIRSFDSKQSEAIPLSGE